MKSVMYCPTMYPMLASWKERLFADPRSAWLWLVVRLFLAYVWFRAGWEKVTGGAWVGPDAGGAVSGFVKGALAKAGGEHPQVLGFYAYFLEHCVAPFPALWSHLVAFGEVAVALGLFFGVMTTAAAFFGAFMNMNFLLAGSASINPVLLPLEVALILAWRVSSRFGLGEFLFKRCCKTKDGEPLSGKSDAR